MPANDLPQNVVSRPLGEDAVRVLLVEDEELFRRGVERMLRIAGFEVVAVEDASAALGAIGRSAFDVLLVDVNLPGSSGTDLLRRVKASDSSAEIVMMSGSAEVESAVAAVKAGAFGFLTKPFTSPDAVFIELRKAAQTKRLHERALELQEQLLARPPRDEIIGTSPKMRDLARVIIGVANTESSVLVLGESGTGKELVARTIHDRSRRAGKPFLGVNCGALAPELVESELFGHSRGAFTTAVSTRAGVFEAANGGTLLLDEIADLPVSAQVKLLRVLQEGEIKPVGSDHPKKVDVRVIAATNVDLKAATAAGKFRQDLYYRLNVIPIQIPPLRERGDDVLLLAHHFLQRHAHESGRGFLRLGDDAIECLLAHPWPGNVRELAHAMEHAVIFSSGDVVHASALPVELRGGLELEERTDLVPHLSAVHGATSPTAAAPMRTFISAHRLDALPYVDARQRILSAFNEAYVSATLEASGRSISEAARRSGMDRSNLRRLIRSIAAYKGGRDD
jgi:two-component system response regulator HydG